MKNEIKLLKNNRKKDWSDLEWVQEFYEFMQGGIPEGIDPTARKLSLSKEDAFFIIWYLQEHFSILPDHIEKCDVCGGLYDSYSEGFYSEEGNEYGYHFCDACDHLAPNEDIE